MLDHGGRLHAVIPCKRYDETFEDDAARARYQSLLERADRVEVLDYKAPSEEAFLAAGSRVANESDLLIAIWDGRDAHGKGGTGDVVRYAIAHAVPTVVIWPEGVDR